jgi:type VI secretion system protein ImpG
LAGPSDPRGSPAFGDTAWRLISHLSLNYLSLIDKDPTAGASTLRSLLELYADPVSAAARQQLAGVRSVSYRRVIRRIPGGGPIAYGSGLEITLTLDDNAFEGTGIFVLAAVLERFFARYTSINSFTQLRLVSSSRGEIKRWPPRAGRRQIL